MDREQLRQKLEHVFRMGVMTGFYYDEKPDVDSALTASIPEMKRVTGRLLAEFDDSAAAELRTALGGLLGLVRDTIATADDLHEVHAADDALARVDSEEVET